MTDHPLKTALVTGAGTRIGRTIAENLGRQGWAVAVHYNRSIEGAEETAEAIAAAGSKAALVQGNLADENSVQALVSKAADQLGPLTCLVNNASVFEYDDAESATSQSWDSHIAVNMRAPFALTQNFAAQLPEGQEGNVINIIDQRVRKLTPHFMTYTISKVGLWGMTQTLAQALAPNIRVNGIGPGPTLPSQHQDKALFDSQIAALPLERGPQPSEIAQAADFILAMPSLTGQMIAVDGGQHLAWQTPDTADFKE